MSVYFNWINWRFLENLIFVHFICDQQKNLRCIAELILNISQSLTLLLTRDICQIIAKVSFNYSKFWGASFCREFPLKATQLYSSNSSVDIAYYQHSTPHSGEQLYSDKPLNQALYNLIPSCGMWHYYPHNPHIFNTSRSNQHHKPWPSELYGTLTIDFTGAECRDKCRFKR